MNLPEIEVFPFLYVGQTAADQVKLLKLVLSNCAIDRSTLYPTYRKPFALIFQAAPNGNWLGGRDSNPDRRIQSPQSYRYTTAQRNQGISLGPLVLILRKAERVVKIP